MRLGDIDGLLTESVYNRGDVASVTRNLKKNGASDAEVAFLLQRRVELNAMTSLQLVEFIERKLRAVGVAKVIPDDETLQQAYRRIRVHNLMDNRIRALQEEVEAEAAAEPMPKDLASRVATMLIEDPKMPWDAALRRINRRP